MSGPGLSLAVGDFLLLEEVLDPTTKDDPDPTHRQVVRLVAVTPGTDRLDATPVLDVEWAARDALTFPLCVSVEGAVTAVARGNVALAAHGETRHAGGLPTETPAPPGRWRPLVPETPIAFVVPYDQAAAAGPAAALLAPDPALLVLRSRWTTATSSGARSRPARCRSCGGGVRRRDRGGRHHQAALRRRRVRAPPS